MLIEICWLVIIVSLILTYLSMVEWSIHRYPMHVKGMSKIPLFGRLFSFFYKNHTVEHHTSYTNFHYECGEERNHQHHKIVLPYWAGPMLIVGASLPVLAIDYVTGYQLHLTWICVPMATLYYIMFEAVHVAMHEVHSFPRRLFGRAMWFQFLQNHHKAHHGTFPKNFNLLCPIADYLFGTVKR